MAFNVEFSSPNKSASVEFEGTKGGNPIRFSQGKDGATFTPNVSLDGIISWTNDQGLPNPPPVNIKGEKGDNGKDGINGKDGKDGVDGRDGYTPVKGVDYFDGINGKDGKDGQNGADGKTPIKGTDYFTEADKAEMIADVISALPVYNGEVVTV